MEEGKKMFGKRKPKRARNIAVISISLVLGCVVCFIAGRKLYYQNRWYPNTKVNGLDVSGKTYAASLELMQDYVSSYALHVVGRDGGELTVTSESIDLKLDFEEAFHHTYEMQKEDSWFPTWGKTEYEVDFSVHYSPEKIDDIMENAAIITGDDNYKVIGPKSAYVTYSKSDGHGVIVEEKLGNKIDEEEFCKILSGALEFLEDEVDLQDAEKYPDVYKKPKYTSQDEVIQKQLETYNAYLLNWLTWDMGEGVQETITPENIKDWLYVTKKNKVKIDSDALSQWIEAFCLKYKTQGTTRSFTTHDGETIQVEGGDYGWCINYTETVSQAMKAISKENDLEAKNAYIEDPSDDNRKALTKELEVIYSNTAFQKDYIDHSKDWDPDNYSEVDLSDQMVYVYKDGKLAYSSICVTGLESDPERATRTGCYYIKDKKEEYILVGEDYETPTKFWVRIMWTGTGYHYLGRSDWNSWTPDLYKTRGSHGCINLQLEDAESIYNLVSMRDAVFIHE